MCGISGFCDFHQNFTRQHDKYSGLLNQMHKLLAHRGPDDQGIYLEPHIGLSHARLSVIDLTGGRQPMLHQDNGHTWAIVYNGELYNTKELRRNLISRGQIPETSSDTEILLLSYLEYGPEFISQINGIFAFAIWDPLKECLLLYRDRSGIKPLFYSLHGYGVSKETLIFASEPKAILPYPGIKAQVDRQGLNEIFSMGPARTGGCGIFHGIDELLPGHYAVFDRSGFHQRPYWKLESHPHEDDYPTTVEKQPGLYWIPSDVK